MNTSLNSKEKINTKSIKKTKKQYESRKNIYFRSTSIFSSLLSQIKKKRNGDFLHLNI